MGHNRGAEGENKGRFLETEPMGRGWEVKEAKYGRMEWNKVERVGPELKRLSDKKAFLVNTFLSFALSE